MKAQITLTVGEGKALIGAAIASRSDVQSALANGKVLLKGGTTVADIACRLMAGDIRISGRISPRGTKAARHISAQPHSVIINKGVVQTIDDSFAGAVMWPSSALTRWTAQAEQLLCLGGLWAVQLVMDWQA